MGALPKCKGLKCPVDPKTCRRYRDPRNPGRQVWVRYENNQRSGCLNYKRYIQR